MLNSWVFRVAAFSTIAACGTSKTPHRDALPAQSIYAEASKPSIYDAGPPSAPVVVDAGDDEADSADPNSAHQNSSDDDAVTPLAITPTLAESAVRTNLEIFVADDGAPFIAAVDKHVAPGRIEENPFGDQLTKKLSAGSLAFRSVAFKKDSNKVLFMLRTEKRAAGMTLGFSDDNRAIIPVEWLRAVMVLKGVDERASRAFYVGISQRLAVAGRSSAIVIFDNGTAAGVRVETHGEVDDFAIVARTEFFPVGGFDESAWGPVIKGVKGVLTKNGNGHAGIDTRDLLSRALGVTMPASK